MAEGMAGMGRLKKQLDFANSAVESNFVHESNHLVRAVRVRGNRLVGGTIIHRQIDQPSIAVNTFKRRTNNIIYNPTAAVFRHEPGRIVSKLDDLVKVGTISYNPEQVLGKGCDGTFVYRGKFDNRDVAVKRLLRECFKIADREVSLLRKSDDHPNVIRYFCTEKDRQFIYIALELCAATVQDYVEGRKYDVRSISPLEILKQATNGLAHLHSLDIVHRDIKPPNILLSIPNNRGEVRAMISDFGFCKKLQEGKMSFSRSSGITGTDGWIAPEMYNIKKRATCAVDLFSLGCLFYYVLSEGKHPFGKPLRRQDNILSKKYKRILSQLKGDKFRIELSRMLISKLICVNADDRPPATAVLLYPVFWDNARILEFFQDVSDRLEKTNDPVIQALEKAPVVRGDWLKYMTPEVAQDLLHYRKYQGKRVRDLLRAIRNLKHHYRELSLEAQHSLGSIPDQFTSYWTSRFPLLLLHSWLAMQCVKTESTFQKYYYRDFEFIEDNPEIHFTQEIGKGNTMRSAYLRR